MLGMLLEVWSSPVVRLAGLSLAVNWVGWAASAALHTEKFYDLTGSLTFLLLSHLSHSASSMNTLVTDSNTKSSNISLNPDGRTCTAGSSSAGPAGSAPFSSSGYSKMVQTKGNLLFCVQK